jgi:hypothetical protein
MHHRDELFQARLIRWDSRRFLVLDENISYYRVEGMLIAAVERIVKPSNHGFQVIVGQKVLHIRGFRPNQTAT